MTQTIETTTEPVVKSIYWTLVETYGGGQTFASFADAVEAARATIKKFVYGETTKFSRAFVALRQWDATSARSTSDHELIRWEVYLDRVVQVPAGSGGLSEEQRDAALALEGAWA